MQELKSQLGSKVTMKDKRALKRAQTKDIVLKDPVQMMPNKVLKNLGEAIKNSMQKKTE